jgi:dihydrolipoamide dehydrogenase
LLRGTGRLAGTGVVEVDGVAHTAEHVVVATGSEPIVPPVPGLRELEGIWTNREATGMRSVPNRLLVLGGGAVGVEMAQAVRRLGGEVVLVEMGERVLSREPAALGDALGEILRADGVEVVHRATASAVRRDGEDYVVALADGRELRGDRLLVATGRRPRAGGIGLETVGVEADPHGIPVDPHLRAADGVWAIGDVTPYPRFTHVGKYQARIAIADMQGENHSADYRAVPKVVFTDPEVAFVGEAEGKATGTGELKDVSRTSTYEREWDKRPMFVTVVSDGAKLTGAYAVGPSAGEWLQQATLAIRAETPLEVLRDVIQPFPTFSEAFFNALDDLD